MGRLLFALALAAALVWVPAPAARAYVELTGNARGDQVLVHQVLGQHNRPLFAGLRPADGSFGPFAPLTGPVDPVERASVIDDAGGAAVAWVTNEVAYEPPTGHVMAAIRPPQGGFEPPVELAPNARYLRLYGNGRGDVLASWYLPDGPGEYSVRPAGGVFGPAQTLPRSLVGAAIDSDGTVMAVFLEFNYPGYRLLQSERPPGGDFGPLRQIPGADHAGDQDLAAAPDGRALLVWDSAASRMATDRLPGADFGAPVEVQKLDPYARIDEVKLSSSGAAAMSSGTQGDRIALRRPGSPFVLSTQRTGAGEVASLAVDARGDVALAWHGGGRRVRAAYRDAGAGTWSKPVRIAGAPAFAPEIYDRPGLAISDSGKATVAWEESNGATVRTYARTLHRDSLGRVQLVDSIPSYFAEGPPSACRPKSARILLRSSRATIFSKPYFGSNEVFGCLFSRGAPVPLVDRPAGFATHTMSIAGPLVAFGSDDVDKAGVSSSVNVIDLRDPGYGINTSVFMEPPDGVTGILLATRLRSNGAVAWISCADDFGGRELARFCRKLGGARKHLFARSSNGGTRLLDSSRRLDRRTLKLSGSLLTWRHGRKLRHARLR